MLTPRGTLLLLMGFSSLVAGLAQRQELVALLGLSFLVWLGLHWIRFQWLVLSRESLLHDCHRSIDGQRYSTLILSTDKEYSVRLTASVRGHVRGLRVMCSDTPPDVCQVSAGNVALLADVAPGEQLTCHYTIRTAACGQVTFPGIALRVADANGLLSRDLFQPLPQQVTVLPFLVRPQTTHSVIKRNNVQRLAGHHRYARGGLGTELLGIRDYQRGDPPRSIAWKATARLGRLMSNEFESEVPIRATILADLSSYQFAGRPGLAVVDRVVAATASIARLLLSDRDPVAVILLSDAGSTRIGHGTGERQLTRLLHQLLRAANSTPRVEQLPMEELVDVIYENASQRFPELFEDRLNRGPVRASLFRPGRRHSARRRCKIAHVLAQLGQLPTASSHRLAYDDQALRAASAKYVREYSVTCVPSTTSLELKALHTAHKRTTQVACTRLMEANARAKDNELFVLVGRPPLEADDVRPMESSLRVIRGAHHRVMIVDTGEEDLGELVSDPSARRILSALDRADDPAQVSPFSRRMRALGIKLARIDDPRLMEQVAKEVDLIRSGRSRVGPQTAGTWR